MSLLIAALLAAGPISRFDKGKPDAEFDSTAAPGKIERCLIDLDAIGLANVFRQPDLPDKVTLVWAGAAAGGSAYRVDLVLLDTGTHVKAWMPKALVQRCAPE